MANHGPLSPFTFPTPDTIVVSLSISHLIAAVVVVAVTAAASAAATLSPLIAAVVVVVAATAIASAAAAAAAITSSAVIAAAAAGVTLATSIGVSASKFALGACIASTVSGGVPPGRWPSPIGSGVLLPRSSPDLDPRRP